VRRIEAVTGVPALAAAAAADGLAEQIDAAASMPDDQLGKETALISTEIDALTLSVVRRAQLRVQLGTLQDRLKALAKSAAKEAAKLAVEKARAIGEAARDDITTVVVQRLDVGSDRAALQQALKAIMDLSPGSAVMLASVDHEAADGTGAAAIIAGVPAPLIEKGLKAGDWVRETTKILGGKGGGRPNQAQGGGSDVAKLDDALEHARSFAQDAIA